MTSTTRIDPKTGRLYDWAEDERKDGDPCNDCAEPSAYCPVAGWYYHIDPEAKGCFLMGSHVDLTKDHDGPYAPQNRNDGYFDGERVADLLRGRDFGFIVETENTGGHVMVYTLALSDGSTIAISDDLVMVGHYRDWATSEGDPELGWIAREDETITARALAERIATYASEYEAELAAFRAAFEDWYLAGFRLVEAWQGERFHADEAFPLPDHLRPPMSLDEWLAEMASHYGSRYGA